VNITSKATLLVLAALLTGCGDREVILEGARFDVRTPLDETLPPPEDATTPQTAQAEPTPAQASALKLQKPVTLSEWTQRGSGPRHVAPHSTLSAAPALVWSASIGAGEDRRHRITADPVVADGRIFTLDAEATVGATSTAGAPLWSVDLSPAFDKASDASGGGLALGAGKLFATTGFGALVAIDPASGKILWRQRLDAAVTGTPMVEGNIVYVVSRDGKAWALEAKDGRIRWSLPSAPAAAVRVGGAAPALTDRLVVFPFGSGELIGALRKSGIRVWSASVSGERRGRAYAHLSDISADPVVSDGFIYTGNPSGRVVKIDAINGQRIWTATEGAISPVVPAGGSLFMVSDNATLVRLDAKTGEVLWSQPLPGWVADKVRRRKAVYAHFGPVLAGGKLWVGSDDGLLRSFDPRSGAPAGDVELPGGAATNPIVVGGTLYIVSTKGQLHAFR